MDFNFLDNLDYGGVKQKEISLDNPFLENKEAALSLIADLTSAKGQADVRKLFDTLISFLKDESEYEDAPPTFKEFMLQNTFYDEYTNIIKIVENTILQLENFENKERFTVAVAGGFSAGKSTFINSLIGKKINLLPTDTRPTSVIPTYISFKRNTNEKSRAITSQNGIIELNKKVIEAIAHEFEEKHHVKLANLIKEINIEVQSNHLDGITFIDTPGFFHVQEKNGISKTDTAAAEKSMKDANVIIWLIDIEKGTIPKDDLRILTSESIKSKRKLIILNKAEKKYSEKFASKELLSITDSVAKQLKVDDEESRIIDIISYSSNKQREYTSYKGKYLNDIFKQFANEQHTTPLNNLLEEFKEYREDANLYYESEINEMADEVKEERDYIFESKRNLETYNYNESIKWIRSVTKDLRNNEKAYDQLGDIKNKFLDIASDSLDREFVWEDKSGFTSNIDNLVNKRGHAINAFNNALNKDLLPFMINYGDILENYFVEHFNSLNEEVKETTNNTSYLNSLENKFKELKEQRKYLNNALGQSIKMIEDILRKYNQSKSSFEKINQLEFSAKYLK